MSNKIQTLNGFIEVFKDIVERHPFLADFGFGPTYNIGAEKPMRFPYMWVWPAQSSIQVLNGQILAIYNFEVLIMDKIDKGDLNYEDSMSDTDFIGNTLVAEFIQSKFYRENSIKINGDIIKFPVQEETDDNANGWEYDISFAVPIKLNSCSIPQSEPNC